MSTILGIHSTNVRGKFSSPHAYDPGSGEGHAWISALHNGRHSTYSLWPDYMADGRENIIDNGWRGTDVRHNVEIHPLNVRNFRTSYDRYYKLDDRQYFKLMMLTKKYQFHTLTNNCASWVMWISKKVTSENINANEFLAFIESPRQLGRFIVRRERIYPTSLNNPYTGQR